MCEIFQSFIQGLYPMTRHVEGLERLKNIFPRRDLHAFLLPRTHFGKKRLRQQSHVMDIRCFKSKPLAQSIDNVISLILKLNFQRVWRHNRKHLCLNNNKNPPRLSFDEYHDVRRIVSET